MNKVIYTFNGKDITMNMFIQIRAVVDILQEQFQISFPEALGRFYRSETYEMMRDTRNGLWAESAEYIVDRLLEEESNSGE